MRQISCACLCSIMYCRIVVSFSRSRIAPSDIAEDSISKSNSKNTSPTSYFKNHSAPDNQQDYSSVSSRAGATLFSSPEELQTAGRLVTAATEPEVAVSPSSERASGPEKPPSTHMSYDPTESRSGVLKLSIDNSPKQSLSQPTGEGSLPRRRRTNRTEAQRIQEFHTDPYVAVIEPVSDRALGPWHCTRIDTSFIVVSSALCVVQQMDQA